MSKDRSIGSAGGSALYKAAEARRLLGVGRNTFYRYVHSGRIPVVRIGRTIFVPKAALDAIIGGEKSAHGASAP
jgi:excisionase family DNA binding protein